VNDLGDGKVWRAFDIPVERFDELPFGAIVIDPNGMIIAYNEYETRLSHLERDEVVGKNFFRDVAPCTAVQAFEGRLKSFLKTNDRVSEAFDYLFPFVHGMATVEITFLRLPQKGQILIAVERTNPVPPPA